LPKKFSNETLGLKPPSPTSDPLKEDLMDGIKRTSDVRVFRARVLVSERSHGCVLRCLYNVQQSASSGAPCAVCFGKRESS
jgi:hypothetical protein